ncbi:hypothetical protein FD754_016010 [Muntiacus muntjak]|uniref:ZP domain-containing protein n=1 Tax=Muntiacus muntjak TaxID=9888 RepID=A0A5N3VPW7_MUNMU|nr:hypothetical protein FD754_016010 [Muntiacus muntjak]
MGFSRQEYWSGLSFVFSRLLEICLLLSTPFLKVSCSMDWVMVSVSPCAHRNWYIFADELYLGSGCPMTRIQTYVYDFIYPVYECGIRIKVVSEEALLFQTELYFNPRHTRYGLRKPLWRVCLSLKSSPAPQLKSIPSSALSLALRSNSHIHT